MFRKAQNTVRIEGILAEVDLRNVSYSNKVGGTTEAIAGTIKVLVDQPIDGKLMNLEIPVDVFAIKYKNNGDLNPVYESIEKLKTDYVSIAACGNKEKADKIRITNASFRKNEFYNQNGELKSTPRVNASFFSKVTGEFNPEATFTVELFVSSIAREVDADGVELDPARLKVQAVVPLYTREDANALNIDLFDFVATNPNVINAIESHWEAGKAYKANGKLYFTSKTEKILDEVDFGESRERVRTISVHDIMITGGSETPLDEEESWTIDEIKAGVAARKARLDALKNKSKKTAETSTAAVDKKKADLGF